MHTKRLFQTAVVKSHFSPMRCMADSVNLYHPALLCLNDVRRLRVNKKNRERLNQNA